MTIQRLQGRNEPFADTVRRLLYTECGLTDVTFLTEGGTNEGRMVSTGLTPATVRLTSESDPNTYMDLTWRELGTTGNDWNVQVRNGNTLDVRVQSGQKRIRLTIPSPITMGVMRLAMQSVSALTDLVSLGAIQGDDTATHPADGITQFAGGTSREVDRTADLRTNTMKYLKKEASLVVELRDGPVVVSESTNSFVRKHAAVTITIIGKHAVEHMRNRIIQARDAIDLVVFTHVASPPYKKAAEDEDSGIERFLTHGINWEPEYEDDYGTIIEKLTGTVQVVYTITP